MIKNNKGLSFIELLISIAIIVILATGVVTGISKLQYANTLKSANRLTNVLNKVRLETMSKVDKTYLYLYHASNNSYYMITENSNTLSSSNLETKLDDGIKLSSELLIYYKSSSSGLNDNSESNLIDEGKFILFSFERSSGRFESNFYEITIVGKYKTTTLHLIKETGRVEND